MSYVPPHLRNKISASDASTSTVTPSARTNSGSASSPRPPLPSSTFYTDLELGTALGGVYHLHTLTCAPQSDDLTAIVIHEGQNREWTSPDKRVLCRTHLDILKTNVGTGPSEKEYPVFVQVPMFKGKGARYEFEGWFRIVQVDYLLPGNESHQQELMTLLEKKFAAPASSSTFRGSRGGHRGSSFSAAREDRSVRRSNQAWQESFKTEWAVLKFERNKEKKDAFVPLEVAAVEAREGDTKKADEAGDQGGDGTSRPTHEDKLANTLKATSFSERESEISND